MTFLGITQKESRWVKDQTKIRVDTEKGNKSRWMCELPSPKRMKAMYFDKTIALYMGDAKLIYETGLKSTCALNIVMHVSISTHPSAYQFHDIIVLQNIGEFAVAKFRQTKLTSSYLFDASLLYNLEIYRHLQLGGRHIQTSDKIDEMLQNTDISGKFPLKYFKLPYRNIYIECGETRNSPLRLYNKESGYHIFEGAYITETSLDDVEYDIFYRNNFKTMDIVGSPNLENFRFFEFFLIGSPKEKTDLLDDCYFHTPILIPNDEHDIEKLISTQIEVIKSDNPNLKQDEMDCAISCIKHIAKVILFINTTSKELEEIDETSSIRKEVNRLPKSSSKRKTAQTKLRYSSKKIFISLSGQENDQNSSNSERQNRNIKTHWRRGHFRHLKPMPPNRIQEKIIWIQPMLVNGMKSDELQEKEYIVTA